MLCVASGVRAMFMSRDVPGFQESDKLILPRTAPVPLPDTPSDVVVLQVHLACAPARRFLCGVLENSGDHNVVVLPNNVANDLELPTEPTCVVVERARGDLTSKTTGRS